MRYALLPAGMMALGCGCAAFGQATTNPVNPVNQLNPGTPVPAAKAIAGPARQRDNAGHVLGPGRAGWWNDGVFYEIFVRSFKDSETGPLAGDGIGDIAGLIEKLDYLNDGDAATTSDLGVTGLWLMPINPSPSYHGYDVTDYRDVNRQYGTLEDFRKLTAACHKRGIRVILDLVLNHCSDRNPWFTGARDAASPTHDWFIWSDTDPGWKGPWNERVWHRLGGGRNAGAAVPGLAPGPLYYYGIFTAQMPDLNFRNAAASEEMLKVVDFWVGKDEGADGYRLDAIRHLVEDGQVQENTPETHAWLKTFRSRLKKANPEAMSVGEVWAPSAVASSYVGDELDMTFEFDLAGAMVDAARTGKAGPVMEAQERVLSLYPPNQYGRFLTNHDQTRVMTALKGDAGAMRTAAAMLLLGPGVPFIYYGEEIGMTGDKPDEHLRTPMQWARGASGGFTSGTPWQAIPASGSGVTVEAQSADASSLLSWYRTLIRVRETHPALACGGYESAESGNEHVLAFVRTGEEPVLVVINLGGTPVREYAVAVGGKPLEKADIGGTLLDDGQIAGRGGATAGRLPLELAAHGAYAFTLNKGTSK
jgi:alpha-amylase